MEELAKPRVVAPVAPAPASLKAGPKETSVGNKVETDMFITYSLDHDIPFVADYYGVSDMLGYKDLPYKAEVDAIDDYLVNEVKSKRLDNTTEAVKARLKQLEKIAGIQNHLPTSQRTKTLAAYVNFLNTVEAIGHGVRL